MAWTAPMTAVAGAFSAADFNTFVRDNLLETLPAKISEPGQYPVGLAGTNSFGIMEAASVATNISDSVSIPADNTVWTPLADALMVETAEAAWVLFTARVEVTNTNAAALVGVSVNGDVPAVDSVLQWDGIVTGNFNRHGASRMVTGLTPGLNEFRIVGSASTSTATMNAASLTVVPL